jgi:hypothetical protein
MVYSLYPTGTNDGVVALTETPLYEHLRTRWTEDLLSHPVFPFGESGSGGGGSMSSSSSSPSSRPPFPDAPQPQTGNDLVPIGFDSEPTPIDPFDSQHGPMTSGSENYNRSSFFFEMGSMGIIGESDLVVDKNGKKKKKKGGIEKKQVQQQCPFLHKRPLL